MHARGRRLIVYCFSNKIFCCLKKYLIKVSVTFMLPLIKENTRTKLCCLEFKYEQNGKRRTNIKHTLDIDVEVSRCFGRYSVVRLTDVCPSRVWSDAYREVSARDSQIYKTRKKAGCYRTSTHHSDKIKDWDHTSKSLYTVL